jgi:hypothetical protein
MMLGATGKVTETPLHHTHGQGEVSDGSNNKQTQALPFNSASLGGVVAKPSSKSFIIDFGVFYAWDKSQMVFYLCAPSLPETSNTQLNLQHDSVTPASLHHICQKF